MADNRTSPPEIGNLGTTPAIQSTTQIGNGEKALRSAYFCYFLAALVMLVTAWVIVQGIQATEPASQARNAKIASGVLLLVLEGCAFSLAGQWREFSFVLRSLGWSIFGLQIVLMTLANYSIGATAGKAAALSTATVAQIVAQADDSRKNAATLRDAAEKLNKSKHGWLNEQGGKTSAEAAKQTDAAAGAVGKLEKMQALTTGTPLVETIGETGLMALSGAISLVMECAGIALMHVAGSLRRKASSGAMPVDEQILELLHRVHGAPVGTVTAQTAAPVAPAQTAPALPVASFKPAATVAPKDASTGLSYSSKTVLAGAGALAALTAAPIVQSAPAPVHEKAPAVPAERVNDDISKRVNDDTSAPMKTGVSTPVNGDVLTSSERVNVDTPDALTKARKQRVARDGAMDTGTGEHDGFRYRRAVAGVKAGKIRPSISGLYSGVEVTAPTARRFLAAMADAGVIVKKGRGYVLAEKYLAKLVKKGGSK